MNILVVGLGSMGKRRVRCLRALGLDNVTGFDLREDRRLEAERQSGIKTAGRLDDLDLSRFDAVVISTSPDHHIEYMRMAVGAKIPSFVEASVLLDGLEEVNVSARMNGVLVAPSCTLRFHPAVRDIQRIVKSRQYGNVTNFSYHSGQYLPDWHPWENVTDYYVSNKGTGACREIVPFELTWLTDIIGHPTEARGLYGRAMDLGCPIDDTYAMTLKFDGGTGTMLVDVVSRYAVRSLIMNMEEGQIMWRWDEPCVNLYEAGNKRWIKLAQREPEAHGGYNRNISEHMYIDETKAFIGAVRGDGKFPNNLDDDIGILKLLYGFEKQTEAYDEVQLSAK